MKKIRLTLALMLILAVLLPCVFSALLAQDANRRRSLIAATAQGRELKWKKKVPLVTITREQAKKHMYNLFKKGGLTKKIAKDVCRVGRKFGFYPEGFDLYKKSVEALSESAAAFYDPHKKKVFMIQKEGGGAGGQASGQMAALQKKLEESNVVHEYTHALDDQIFKISKYQEIKKKQHDRMVDQSLAVKALMEGSALNTQFSWFFGVAIHNNSQARKQMLNMLHQSFDAHPALADMPEILKVSNIWIYFGGEELVNILLKKGGQAELNKAYKDPPLTTEQVLHPEKYLNRDHPTPIKIDEKKLLAILGKKWKSFSKNCFGELIIHTFLKAYIGDDAATTAAAGWDGDLYAPFFGKEKNQTLIIWLTVWDSDQDRDEFFDACKKALEGKHSASATTEGDTCTMDGKEGPVLIEKKGKHVLVIDGAPKDKMEELKKEAWTNVKTE